MEPRPALSGEAKGRPGLPGTTVRRSSFDAAGMSLTGLRVVFMPLPDMTPAQLLAGAAEVASRFPAAVLIKNDVGNLAILAGGGYAGYLDLRTGEVCT